MPLDGIFLSKVKNEISSLIGAHVDKIYQPSKDELVFLLRSKEGAFRLLISARQGASRLHITHSKPENPANPPMFCMLLRKHLGSAKLLNLKQDGFERIITLVFSAKNEMGDTVTLNLICEFIGNKPNIILTNENFVIFDAVHRSDIETASRLIQPGAVYEFPLESGKLNLINDDIKGISDSIISKKLPLWKAILDTLEGFSPLTAREVALNITNDFEQTADLLDSDDRHKLESVLIKLKENIISTDNPVIVLDTAGVPFDFSYLEITQYSPEFSSVKLNDFCSLLDAFYERKENAQRIKSCAQDILKILNLLISRTQRKTELRKKDLETCKDREKYRIYGELIKANLYRIPIGVSSFLCENYYDENLALIEIPLNPALSPAANADKYFKEYKKSYTAEKMLTKLIENDAEDLSYFNSVLDNLSRAETIAELDEIREELSEAGIIKLVRNSAKKQRPTNSFKEFSSPSGFKILVGKNNRQNDFLTLNFASKNDIWFHTKNIPGSHTVLIGNGSDVPEEDILYTAGIAALHSKAYSSSSVPVDYTLIKFVKKPGGAKPGMVIYSKEKTVFVTPSAELLS